jgi:RNA polymerase-associated protein
MALVANKRSIMTLFSEGLDLYSHQTRIVLAEKGVSVDIIDVNPSHYPEELSEVNPYNSVPTLIDRDLVLYNARIIMEYLDERFPHPPLLPVYPVSRAQCRLMMYRIERDWYSLIEQIDTDNLAKCEEPRKQLQQSLLSVTPIFKETPYFLTEEFTLVDCYIAPMLWRLPIYGIELPKKQAAPIYQYMERVFARDSFQASLSEAEREIHSDLEVD